jgi:hypothetical protein
LTRPDGENEELSPARAPTAPVAFGMTIGDEAALEAGQAKASNDR